MKKYSTPFAELIEIKAADVITVSAEDNLAEYDDKATAPDSWFNKSYSNVSPTARRGG